MIGLAVLTGALASWLLREEARFFGGALWDTLLSYNAKGGAQLVVLHAPHGQADSERRPPKRFSAPSAAPQSGIDFNLTVTWNRFDRTAIPKAREKFLDARAVTYVTACFMEDVDREDALDQDGTNQNNDDRDAVIRNRKERIDRFKAQLSMALCSLLATTNPSRVLVIANKFCTDDDDFMKVLAGNGIAVVDVGVGYRHWPPVLKGEYPRLTCCLFTFNKLLIWRLGDILPEGEDTPIVWYDSDILWKKNATVGLIEKYRDAYDGNGVVAAQWPAEFMKGDVVLNSGVMLLRPSTEIFLKLEASWANGEYKLVNAEKDRYRRSGGYQ
ncbi:hypothetical protein FOZ60_001914 [Perkinsus olseni]|uniref:Nucleotide-diphospho-sugar transferase domain-containing protein n=1 Tax=Perkinsus olseni TaxID=32597 RepID=A0A7J6P1R6_PEROL|nr:hypothetical protein FOZ60_001914 [Perkinsus olseni]